MNKSLKRILARYPMLYRIASYIKYLNNILKCWGLIKKLSRFYNLESYKDKRVIFNLVRAETFRPLLFESALAIKLSNLGANAKVLYDDGMLKHHDTIGDRDILSQKDILLKSKMKGLLLNNLPFYVKYSELITKQEVENASIIALKMIESNNFVYKNIDLKPYIVSSVTRFFRSAPELIKYELPYEKALKESTENAIISVIVASNVERILKPDIIVTSHGIYTTWGPFYEYFKRKGKRVITYDFGGYKNNGVLFSQQGLVPNRCDDGFFKYWNGKNKENIGYIEKTVSSLMNKRFTNSFPDQESFMAFTNSNEVLPLSVKIALQNNKKLFALFPNVEWDNSLTKADGIFNSSTQWIIETIKFFEKQEDKVLVIRAHPAEATSMKTSKGVKYLIESTLHRNVRSIRNLIFIDSDYQLSSYLLFRYIKAGIVYNGTIGLEMMYKNIPVLIAGKAPYSKRGFTVDFDSKEEYFKYIDKTGEILLYQQNHRNLLIKFLYFYFVINEIPISFFDEKKKGVLKDKLSLKDIIADKNLTYIAETIIGKHQFFQEWYINNKQEELLNLNESFKSGNG